MELHHFGAQFRGGMDLVHVGLDKHADSDAGPAQLLDSGAQLLCLSQYIKPAFCGDLPPTFRHQTHFMWLQAQCDGKNFRGVTHFKIQVRSHIRLQPKDVRILNVAAVGAKVDRYAMRPCLFARKGCLQDVGFTVVGVQ